jgi:transposase
VEAIGVDEIHWGRGLRADNFLTVIYQIDAGCRRLLWVGKGRSQATLRRGLKALGPEVVQGLQFVCSDMWKPYLQVIAAQAGQALHVLDRFHITTHLNQAVDQVRRAESSRLRAAGKARAQRLKHLRCALTRSTIGSPTVNASLSPARSGSSMRRRDVLTKLESL